jgi:hypothetical protein
MLELVVDRVVDSCSQDTGGETDQDSWGESRDHKAGQADPAA